MASSNLDHSLCDFESVEWLYSNSTSLHFVYHVVLAGLERLSSTLEHQTITDTASHLKQWGESVFHVELPIDRVLRSKPEGGETLRKDIEQALVDILQLENCEFEHLYDAATTNPGHRDIAIAIKALLETDHLAILTSENAKRLCAKQAKIDSDPNLIEEGCCWMLNYVGRLEEMSARIAATRNHHRASMEKISAKPEERILATLARSKPLTATMRAQPSALGAKQSKCDDCGSDPSSTGEYGRDDEDEDDFIPGYLMLSRSKRLEENNIAKALLAEDHDDSDDILQVSGHRVIAAEGAVSDTSQG